MDEEPNHYSTKAYKVMYAGATLHAIGSFSLTVFYDSNIYLVSLLTVLGVVGYVLLPFGLYFDGKYVKSLDVNWNPSISLYILVGLIPGPLGSLAGLSYLSKRVDLESIEESEQSSQDSDEGSLRVTTDFDERNGVMDVIVENGGGVDRMVTLMENLGPK